MRYKLLKENVKLIFIKDIDIWKRGDVLQGRAYFSEDQNKITYLVGNYFVDGTYLMTLDDLRDKLISDIILSDEI